MQMLAVSEVSSGLYCNRNPKNGTETFYMVTCDNFKQLRIQCLVYLPQMIKTSGLHAVQW